MVIGSGAVAQAQVSAGGLGTRVNGTALGRCTGGICSVQGGTRAGQNQFYRFSQFDTRSRIQRVDLDTRGRRNVVVGVGAPDGSFFGAPVHLSESANLFWLSPGGIWLGQGARLADIEHFTALAEKISPEELLQWLNQAMERLVGAIQREGGLVNKFTGDGLLAVFGTPLGRGAREDALAALRVAVAIRQEMGDLNRDLKANAHPPVRLRLAIHSGRVLVGSIGSPERWEYGVVGDVVNCAYRIDTLASQLHSDAAECRILLSGTTRNLVEDGFSSTLVWKSWGLRALSGRSRQEEIWELVQPQGEVGST
jgi:class 3 adenylate cyclase